MNTIRPIRTEKDYQKALKAIAPFFDNEPKPNTEEGNYFEILLTLIEAYEHKNFSIAPPDPIEAIKFRMEQMGLTPKDLESIIGQRNRVYEILNHKRTLTLQMIRRLNKSLGIPAQSLIQVSTSQ